MLNPKFILLLVPLVLTPALLSSCTTRPSGAAPSPSVQPIAITTPTLQEQPSSVPPALVQIGIDQTGSMESARVAPLQVKELDPLVQALIRTGGTLSVAAICERSNRPLVRISFPQLPRLSPHQLQNPVKPEPPPKQGNPFKLKEAQKQYAAQLQAYNRATEQNQQALADIQHEVQKLQRQNHDRYQQIKPQIAAILNHPRDCQQTDIQGAVERANLFFREPNNTWSQAPRRYALFITDGLDTFSDKPAHLQANTVLLVNGTPEVGVFEKIPHQRFESPQAAIAQLTRLVQTP